MKKDMKDTRETTKIVENARNGKLEDCCCGDVEISNPLETIEEAIDDDPIGFIGEFLGSILGVNQERIINNEFCEDIAIETKKDENGGETIIIYINGGDGSGVD